MLGPWSYALNSLSPLAFTQPSCFSTLFEVVNRQQIYLSGPTVSRTQGTHCLLEITEEPPRWYIPQTTHSLYTHTHIPLLKETIISLLALSIAGINTTTLLILIFHAFTSVSVKLFWGFQKYCGTLILDRLHQSEWDPTSEMCLIAIIVTPALDSGSQKARESLVYAWFCGWYSNSHNSKSMCSRPFRHMDDSRPGFRCKEARGHPFFQMLLVWGSMIFALILQFFQSLW